MAEDVETFIQFTGANKQTAIAHVQEGVNNGVSIDEIIGRYFEGKESVRNSDAYRQMEVDELMARASSGFSNQSRQSGSGREEEAASPPGVAPALNGLAASATASALANATAAWASIANGPQGNNAAAAAATRFDRHASADIEFSERLSDSDPQVTDPEDCCEAESEPPSGRPSEAMVENAENENNNNTNNDAGSGRLSRENSAARSDSSEVANFAEVTGVDRAQAHEVVAKFKSAGLSSLDAMVQTFFEATDLQQSGGGDGNTVVDVSDANGGAAAAADANGNGGGSSNGWMSQTYGGPTSPSNSGRSDDAAVSRASSLPSGRVEVSSSINFDEMLRGVNPSIDLTPVDGGPDVPPLYLETAGPTSPGSPRGDPNRPRVNSDPQPKQKRSLFGKLTGTGKK